MEQILLFTIILVQCTAVASAFDIRLWPVNARGNEGFVEAYHNGEWGLNGSPEYRFSDTTDSFLCSIQGLSCGWTLMDNYGGYVWIYGLECNGDETDIEECNRPYKWDRYNYSNQTDCGYRHGTRLSRCANKNGSQPEYRK